MIVTTVNEENASYFTDLIAPEIASQIKTDGVFTLGALAEENGKKYAAGVLLFSIEEGNSDGELLTAAVIKWLYIDEEYRGKGAADELVSELIRIAGQSGVEHIICDIPMTAQYDELCGYFEALGFVFTITELPFLDTTLEALFEQSAFKRPPQENVCQPLSAVSASQFKQLTERIDSLNISSEPLSSEKSDYDNDVSCVCCDNSGALLVTYFEDYGLELKSLVLFDKDRSKAANMLLFAINAARSKYTADTELHITCHSQPGADIIDRLFSNAQPRMIRRGYLSIYDIVKEAEE